MFSKISSIFSVLFVKTQVDPKWFQMGSKAVPTSSNWQGSRTIPWISHGQTKLCIQGSCTFVSLCIHFRWNSMESHKCIHGVMKCILGSVWQFWIQNHSLESQSVSKDLFSNFGSRTIPRSHKVYVRIHLAIQQTSFDGNLSYFCGNPSCFHGSILFPWKS